VQAARAPVAEQNEIPGSTEYGENIQAVIDSEIFRKVASGQGVSRSEMARYRFLQSRGPMARPRRAVGAGPGTR
jgi:hypothetical protein